MYPGTSQSNAANGMLGGVASTGISLGIGVATAELGGIFEAAGAGEAGAAGTEGAGGEAAAGGVFNGSTGTLNVIEQDGNTFHLGVDVPEGSVEIMTDVEADGTTVTLNGTHVYGTGDTGAVRDGKIPLGRDGLNNVAQTIGEKFGATKVIINGGKRATGPNAGSFPKPVIYTVK